MTSLWFVTPAFKRFELTAICLDQRLQVMRALGEAGIEARQVVIADDENLDIARERGMDVVEQNNEWLGRKFNDGQEYAGKHGATWVVPIGADSWLDPAYLMGLPNNGKRTRSSHMYAPVRADKLATLNVGLMGAGPHVWHRSLLEPVGFRPAPDNISRNTDSSSIAGLKRPPVWEWLDIHPLQYVGFRVAPYITQYDLLWQRWGVKEYADPWAELARHYPADLVDRVRTLMTPG